MVVTRELRRILLACGVVGLAIGAAAPIAAASSGPRPAEPVRTQEWNPVQRANQWMKRAREGRVRIDGESVEALQVTIGDLRLMWALHGDRGEDCAAALLDLLGLALVNATPEVAAPDTSPVSRVRDLAAEALTAHMDTAFVRWLAHHVMPLSHSQPAERRLAAITLLGRRHDRTTKLALFECAREGDARVRDAALLAMVGWEDDTVHAFFLELLTAASAPERARWAEKHFESVKIGPESRVHAALADLVKRRLSSTDWRTMCQALLLSRCLDHAAIVPFLIESMSAWKARGAAGAQSLRMQFEILNALELRSGRSLGLHPANWQMWWAAVQQGDVRGQSPQTFGGRLESTRASFFGVHANTDRVTFVIDRSGSMDQAFGVTSRARGSRPHTRWNEAVNQLLAFVEQMGPRGRFNIVLFHDYAESWQPRLAEATPENLAKAREWLTSTGPGGGTLLMAGVERALVLGPDGAVDLAKIEADTIIVLCDGETAEGPGWVEPFLARVNSLARVIFHAVQIGSTGDGTLKRLADGSGGEFVMSDG